MSFESLGSCTEYITGWVQIALPKSKPYCNYCVIGCRYDEGNRRHICRFTGEVLLDPFHSRPERCPVRWEE